MAYSDGRAINIVAPKDVKKGDFVHYKGWNGIAMETKSSGEDLAMEISTERLFYVTIPNSISDGDAALGKILYTDDSGVLTATAGSNMAALKVVEAVDANKVVGVRLLNYTAPPA